MFNKVLQLQEGKVTAQYFLRILLQEPLCQYQLIGFVLFFENNQVVHQMSYFALYCVLGSTPGTPGTNLSSHFSQCQEGEPN